MNTREDYDGIMNKPPMEEIIEHGLLQKAHKYIDKYMKNGKWIYRYKSKAQEVGTKINRKLRGVDSDQESLNYGKEPIYGYAHDNGKATSRTGTRGNFQGRKGRDVMPASGHTDGLRVNAGINAGRKRAKKKAITEKFLRRMGEKSYDKASKEARSMGSHRPDSNARARGAANSRGSADNNKATNNVLKGRENREYIKNKTALLKAKSSKYNNETYTRESAGKRNNRVKRINEDERLLRSKGWYSKNGILLPPKYSPEYENQNNRKRKNKK